VGMRVLNKKYWPHQVHVNDGMYDKDKSVNHLERWCYENLETKNWRNVGYYFAFKNGADATMFMLRWT
jgi:hypothetical protein